MLRSFIPFLLASLGFTLVALALNMPLFEWQINEIATDFPPTYEFHVYSSSWTTYLGDSLNDSSYILRREVRVRRDDEFCREEGLNFVVKRSQNDERLERVLNISPKMKPVLFTWISTEVILSGIYIWWFIIGYKNREVVHAVIFTVMAVFICFFSILVMRLFGSFPYYFFGPRIDFGAACYGTITFNAALSKAHYETLFILFASICAETGAIGMMLRQITKAVIEQRRNYDSKLKGLIRRKRSKYSRAKKPFNE